MAPPRRTDDQCRAVAAAYFQFGCNRRRAAAYLGISTATFQNQFEDAQARGFIPDEADPNPMPGSRKRVRIKDGIVIVGSDAHYYPGEASTAHRAFVRFAEQLKPKLIVMNGDCLDGSSISRHARIGWDKKPSVKEELEAVTVRLNEIEAVAGSADLYWPLGNHDARFETFLAANAPQYEGVKGTSLKDFFPRWRPCWSLEINDDVIVKHRYKGGLGAIRNNALWSGKTMVTSHLHALHVEPLTDYHGTRWGVDTGCLAATVGEQFEDYLEAGPVNWRSGFIVLTFKDGQLLDPETVRVWDEDRGLVCFRGTLGAV